MRDFQKQRVYDAEQSVRHTLDALNSSEQRTMTLHGSTIYVPVEMRFGTLDAIQMYVDRVMLSLWFREAWPHAMCVHVRQRKGNSFAHYEYGTIAINDTTRASRQWAMRELVVLHELAHHVSRDQHGPHFTACYLRLLEECMGPEIALLMRDSMHAHRVEIGAAP